MYWFSLVLDSTNVRILWSLFLDGFPTVLMTLESSLGSVASVLLSQFSFPLGSTFKYALVWVYYGPKMATSG